MTELQHSQSIISHCASRDYFTSWSYFQFVFSRGHVIRGTWLWGSSDLCTFTVDVRVNSISCSIDLISSDKGQLGIGEESY